MIWIYDDDRLCEGHTLLEALGITGDSERCPVISAVGAGGKTTTLHRLADELVRAGRRVVATTTTHIQEEEDPRFFSAPFAADEFEEKLAERIERFGQAWTGMPRDGRKLGALPEEMMDRIWKQSLPVLIEADGARRMPLKIPAGHEPVIDPRTTHVVSLYGLDSLGQRFEDVCFRPELAEALLKKERSGCVTEEDLAVLAASKEAGRKGCPEGAVYTVILNKADSAEKREAALSICRKLKSRGVTRVIVTSYTEKGRRKAEY